VATVKMRLLENEVPATTMRLVSMGRLRSATAALIAARPSPKSELAMSKVSFTLVRAISGLLQLSHPRYSKVAAAMPAALNWSNPAGSCGTGAGGLPLGAQPARLITSGTLAWAVAPAGTLSVMAAWGRFEQVATTRPWAEYQYWVFGWGA